MRWAGMCTGALADDRGRRGTGCRTLLVLPRCGWLHPRAGSDRAPARDARRRRLLPRLDLNQKPCDCPCVRHGASPGCPTPLADSVVRYLALTRRPLRSSSIRGVTGGRRALGGLAHAGYTSDGREKIVMDFQGSVVPPTVEKAPAAFAASHRAAITAGLSQHPRGAFPASVRSVAYVEARAETRAPDPQACWSHDVRRVSSLSYTRNDYEGSTRGAET